MKSRNKILNGVIVAFTIAYISSCTVTPIENSQVNPGPQFEGTCFETEVLPILVSRCATSGCHNTIDKADDIDLTSYAEIIKEVEPGNPGDSEIIETMYDNGDDAMPPLPAERVPQGQITVIENWIKEGALNTTDCNNNTNCNLTIEISFANQVIPIIDKYCYGCHSTNDPQGGYAYTTYNETLKSVNDGTLVGSIRFDNGFVAMPHNTNKMPDCEVNTIVTWVEQGAMNN